jgi:hypothetical protein
MRYWHVPLLLIGSFLVQCGDDAIDPDGDADAAPPPLSAVMIVDAEVQLERLDSYICASSVYDTRGMRRIVAHHDACSRWQSAGASTSFQWKLGVAGFASDRPLACDVIGYGADSHLTELDGHFGSQLRYVESFDSAITSCPKRKLTIVGYLD